MEEIKILTQQEIESGLKDLPGWAFADDKIKKEFKFKDFMDALGFINSLAPYFEEMDHHADMHIFYNRIVFELQRHASGGKVTDKDLIVAREIENRHAKIAA